MVDGRAERSPAGRLWVYGFFFNRARRERSQLKSASRKICDLHCRAGRLDVELGHTHRDTVAGFGNCAEAPTRLRSSQQPSHLP